MEQTASSSTQSRKKMEQTASSSRLSENGSDTNNEPKYKGIRKRKWGKWVSEIRLPNSRERIWLGSYDSAKKAARAFDAAQFCLRGQNASFNFPDNPPDIPGGRSMSPQEIQEAAAKYANYEEEVVAPSVGPALDIGGAVQDDVMDWSFWDMLDGNYDGGFGHVPGEFFPPAPPPLAALGGDEYIEEEQNGEETAFTSSFLWNF